MTLFVRSPFNYDVEAASSECAIGPGGPSLTVQSMSEETDLNIMLTRFGVIPKMPDNVRLPTYGDFSGVDDYASAMQAILDAQENFLELPADVRARFENNPQKLLDFVCVPENREEVKKIFGVKSVDNLPLVKDNTPAVNNPAGDKK